MTIGNKEIFAVEFEKYPVNLRMGYAKIWIDAKFIGTKEDLIFLKGYLLALLDEIINAPPISIKFQNETSEEIFEIIRTKEERSDFAISGSTFTDDFEIYSFKKDEKIVLIWKLRDVEMIFDELKEYSKELQVATVDLNEVQRIRNMVFEGIN